MADSFLMSLSELLNKFKSKHNLQFCVFAFISELATVCEHHFSPSSETTLNQLLVDVMQGISKPFFQSDEINRQYF